jgi:1,4-alpha-glucan branching enzyme
MQVWSRDSGYPGAAPYLEFHKIRWPGGLKLWRVSGPRTDLGDKEPYEPQTARGQSRVHARHFTALLDRLAADGGREDRTVVVAPFDTELYGHWWFEGPDFLGDVYAMLPEFARLRAVTGGAHLASHAPRTGLRLGTGSWGKNGDYSMWFSDQVAWTWPVIWELEDAFWDLAARALEQDSLHEILAQAAREVLLLQSSDWQFIISSGEVADYAIRRFNGHAQDARAMLDALRVGLAGGDVDDGLAVARELQQRDDIFRDIVPSIREAIARSAELGGQRALQAAGSAPTRGRRVSGLSPRASGLPV